MTTQTINAGIWGKAGGREFSVVATDGIFTNALTTDSGSAQIGEAMKGQTIDHICVDYGAGSCVYKLVNRVSQQTQREGFAFVSGQADPAQSNIAPYVVQLDDVLQIFCVAVTT